MENKRRIVVTGIGLVTPFGVGVDRAWDAIKEGRSGIRRITKFDTEGFACQIAAEVPEGDEEGAFKADDFIDRKEQKKMDKFIQFGYAASVEAIEMANIADLSEESKLRTGLVLGSGVGGLPEIERTCAIIKERGPRRVSPFFIPSILPNLLGGHVSMKYGFKGPNSCIVTACATASHSIGTAKRMIEDGEADVMIAGGAESCICPSAVAGFAAAKALSTGYNDDPENACRPFDEGRDGFVMAEGAGVLVLEEYEHAKARGATILAEMAGFGQSGDAYHMTSPSPDGDGGKRAMQAALADAGIEASEIGYVNAHATSTPTGDSIESKSIEATFGSDVLVSSTKSVTGHALGAAGGFEAAFSVLALRDGIVPPTMNLKNVSEGCNLDYVPNEARKVELNAVLSNSFGFGGTNASLIFKKI